MIQILLQYTTLESISPRIESAKVHLLQVLLSRVIYRLQYRLMSTTPNSQPPNPKPQTHDMAYVACGWGQALHRYEDVDNAGEPWFVLSYINVD